MTCFLRGELPHLAPIRAISAHYGHCRKYELGVCTFVCQTTRTRARNHATQLLRAKRAKSATGATSLVVRPRHARLDLAQRSGGAVVERASARHEKR